MEAILNTILTWLTGGWQDAGTSALKSAIDILIATPWADLRADWYMAMFGAFFGLLILISLLRFIIGAIALALTRDTTVNPTEALLAPFRALIYGFFALVGLAIVASLVDLLSQAIVSMFDMISNGDWRQEFGRESAGLSGWQGLAYMAGLIFGGILWAQAVFTQFAVMIFAILGFIGFTWGGKFGGWVLMIAKAAFWATFGGRLLQILWIGLCSIFLEFTELGAQVDFVVLMICVVVTVAIPPAIFAAYIVKDVLIDGKVRVKGGDINAKTKSDQHHQTSKAVESANVQQQAGAISKPLASQQATSIKAHAPDSNAAPVRNSSSVLSSSAVQRGAHIVGTKLVMMPHPYAKAAGATVIAGAKVASLRSGNQTPASRPIDIQPKKE